MDARPRRTERSLRVLVVESHPGLCRGLKELLPTYPDIALVETVTTVEHAAALVSDLLPDVVLIGLDLVERSWCDAIWEVKGGSRETRVVVLGLDALLAPEALTCGADDFLVVGCSSEELVNALFGERVGPQTLAADSADAQSNSRPGPERRKS